MIRNLSLALAIVLCLTAQAVAEPRHGEFEVHELTLWIIDGAADMANAKERFHSAFPVTTPSMRAQRSSQAPSPPGPIGLITFYGQPTDGLDVELRMTKGSFLAHSPPAKTSPNRLQWGGASGTELLAQPGEQAVLFTVDEDHWMRRARQTSALFVSRGTRVERFLAYDAEMKLSSPVQLQGGPDKFTIANVSESTIYDVLVARRTAEGVQVAWLDELPKTEIEPGAAAPTSGSAPIKPQLQRTAGLFSTGKNQAAADGSAQPNAKEVAKEIVDGKSARNGAGETKNGTRLFGLAVPKAAPDKSDEASKPKHPAAGLFGLAPAADAQSKLAGGIDIELSKPLPGGSKEADAATSGELTKRLERAGLTGDEIKAWIKQHAASLFDGDGLIVACRLAPTTIDAQVALSVFPAPQRIVRVPIVLIRNVDPQLPRQIESLIAQLGHAEFARRQEAEEKLIAFGPLAFESLKQAINDQDMEIVIRSERILLKQGQQAAGRQGTVDATNAKPAQATPRATAPAQVNGTVRPVGN